MSSISDILTLNGQNFIIQIEERYSEPPEIQMDDIWTSYRFKSMEIEITYYRSSSSLSFRWNKQTDEYIINLYGDTCGVNPEKLDADG